MIEEGRRKWWILAAMGGVLGLVVIDQTVVGVALPTIRDELHMSQVGAHWIVNGYLLLLTCLAVAGGRLGDLLGHRRPFLGGIALFGLASFSAGFAQDGAWMIASRVVQGVGAALIFPATATMIAAVFAPRQRGTALGIFTAIGGVFFALGPMVGGWFTETFSWRWVFWINLPIVAAVATVVLLAWREAPHDGPRPRLDVTGLMTLLVGLAALVIGIMQGGSWGWASSRTLALLAVGVAILLLFVTIERRAADPLIAIELFRNPVISACNLAIFAGQFGAISVVVYVALYLQDVLHVSPFQAGLMMLPAVLPLPFMPIVAGRLADRFGTRWPTILGLLLYGAAFGFIALAVSFRRYEPMVAPLLLWGLTLAFLYVPTRRAVMNAVPADQRGQASGINMTAQFLGGTCGVAISGTLLIMTRDYQIVFMAPAVLSMVVLIIACFGLAHEPRDAK